MMTRTLTSKMLIGGATIGALALIAPSSAVFAQDESPAASPAAEEATQEGGFQEHPLHIHLGTCAELGDVLFPLGVISEDLMVNGGAAAGDEVGTVSGDPVMLNVTVVDATVGDLVDSEHAINVHQSEDDIETYIACGDIGGRLINDSGVAFQLEALNDSGFSGIAWLNENDDGNTTVYTFLTEDTTAAGEMTDVQAEESPMADEGAMADESPMADEGAVAEESPMAGESPMADEGAVADESPMADEADAEMSLAPEGEDTEAMTSPAPEETESE